MTLLQKITQVRSLSRAINTAKKILTERGEANSASMANEIFTQYRALNEDQKLSFYHALATKFNPETVTDLTLKKPAVESVWVGAECHSCPTAT